MEEKLDVQTHCICGNDLILTIGSIYGPNKTIYCNKCMKTIQSTDIIYHCIQKNIKHSSGYDLCCVCYHDVTQFAQSSKQTKSMNTKHESLPTDSWSCSVCTLINDSHITECVVCGHQEKINKFENATYPISCNGSVNCLILRQFGNIMQKYQEYNKIDNEHKQENTFYNNIQQILDDFLHLLSAHNNDNHFEFIANLLGHCDINQCVIFKRNYRNRKLFTKNHENRNELYKNANDDDIVWHQLLDKMHCFFSHSYDIGNKLSFTDKQTINKMQEEKVNEDFQNKRINKIYQILCSKKKNIKNAKILIDRTNAKYNQLSEQKIEDDKGAKNENIMYSFGCKFNYGHWKEKWADDGMVVFAKYDSLKEELITNEISTISMEQFSAEYEKAIIHFSSEFRKKNYRNLFKEHILSLMIYCNYDQLQYEMSKTYRENVKEHNNFYHLAKYLKMTIKEFGTEIMKGNISTFYHGIGQQLLFPQYVAHSKKKYKELSGVAIHGPLSTTSIFEVAINFTNNNNGLIVEFGCRELFEVVGDHQPKLHKLPFIKFGDRAKYWRFQQKTAKYFSVSWLSDYANESEHLFIQNNDIMHETLDIRNIFDAKEGHSFDMILNCIKIIERITNNVHDSFQEIIPLNMQKVITKILHHQLSAMPKYKSCELPKYGQKILKAYFNNKKYVEMNYFVMENWVELSLDELYRHGNWLTKFTMLSNHTTLDTIRSTQISSYNNFLFPLLFYETFRWIKLKELFVLFPNIQNILVKDVTLCSEMVGDIIKNLKNNDNKLSIRIEPSKYSVYSKEYVISKYKHQFVEMNCNIALHGDHHIDIVR